MATLEFWFDFASSYSYLSAMRIEKEAQSADVNVVWKPFLLGPIFKARGWDTSPFSIHPDKGRYMMRDIQRIAQDRNIPFQFPAVFPQNSLQAARLAITGLKEGWGIRFVMDVFSAEFAEGRDIGAAETLDDVLRGMGLEPEKAKAAAQDADIKAQLRQNTENAQARGVFGAPAFVIPAGDLFWGDDRLEQAITWAKKAG